MKIGLIVHRFAPAIGGSERYAEVLANKLHEAGHEVTVYTTRHPDRDRDSFPYQICEFTNVVPENFGYFAWPEVFTPSTIRSLRAEDAIHAVVADMFAAVVGALVKKAFGTPAVLSTFYHPPKVQTHQRLKHHYDTVVLQRVLQQYDALFVSSDFELEQLEQNFDLTACKPVRKNIPPTLATSPSEDFRETHDLCDAFVLLYVGRLDGHKGIETLLTAVDRLADSHPSLRCVVVGETERWHEWPASVASIIEANEDRFVFTGVRTGGDLAAVYEAADLFVFPSSYETYGLVTVEALSYETPVVATRVGIAPELIEDGVNGFLYDQADTDALVQHIEQVATTSSTAMRTAAKDSVAELSWSTMVDDFVTYYGGSDNSS
jgi:glycosyltransferase involved in cell wall biosynthesis